MKAYLLVLACLMASCCASSVPRSGSWLSDMERSLVGEWEYTQTNMHYGKHVTSRVVLALREDRSARVFKRPIDSAEWVEITSPTSKWRYASNEPILYVFDVAGMPNGKIGFNVFMWRGKLSVDDLNEIDPLDVRSSTVPGLEAPNEL